MVKRMQLSDETRDGLLFEMRLASNLKVTARCEEYNRKVEACRAKARDMTKEQIIGALVAHNPAYIRSLLETEDQRFGSGPLVERYARNFYNAS